MHPSPCTRANFPNDAATFKNLRWRKYQAGGSPRRIILENNDRESRGTERTKQTDSSEGSNSSKNMRNESPEASSPIRSIKTHSQTISQPLHSPGPRSLSNSKSVELWGRTYTSRYQAQSAQPLDNVQSYPHPIL